MLEQFNLDSWIPSSSLPLTQRQARLIRLNFQTNQSSPFEILTNQKQSLTSLAHPHSLIDSQCRSMPCWNFGAVLVRVGLLNSILRVYEPLPPPMRVPRGGSMSTTHPSFIIKLFSLTLKIWQFHTQQIWCCQLLANILVCCL